MAMGVNTNVQSINAQRMAAKAQESLGTSMARLSSGLRVNSAKDDSAGLAIADRMDAQTRGMTVAIRNANDGISLTQTAEGALTNIGNMLQRMRELTVQAGNATYTSGDVSALNKEMAQLSNEVGRIMSGTQFNGKSIMIGEASAGFSFQVGANVSAGAAGDQTIAVASGDIFAANDLSGVINTTSAGGLAVASGTAAASTNSAVLTAIDNALKAVNEKRASLGAIQSRFDNTINNLNTSIENQSAARGRIVDADFAVESANLSKSQILQQASTAMIAQANQLSQGVMSLLR
jgi:flagellin